MSLISQALKKIEEQRSAGGRPAIPPRILVRPGPRPQRGRLLLLGGVALFTGAVLAGVFFLLGERGSERQSPALTVPRSPHQMVAQRDVPEPVKTAVSQAAAPAHITPAPKIVEEKAPPDRTAADQPPRSMLKREAGVETTIKAVATQESTATSAKGREPPQHKSAEPAGRVRLDSETIASPLTDYREAVALQKEERWQEAIAAYRRVLRWLPASAEVYNNLGVIHEKQGDLKEAVVCYEKAIEIDPNFYPSFNNLGIIYYRLKNYEKARAAYEQALKMKPDNSQSLINLALVYGQLGRPDLARRAFEQVLARDPDNSEAHYNLARLLVHYHRFLEVESTAYPRLREAVQARISHLQAGLSLQ
jgi:Flp pilus assembly protein TadD